MSTVTAAYYIPMYLSLSPFIATFNKCALVLAGPENSTPLEFLSHFPVLLLPGTVRKTVQNKTSLVVAKKLVLAELGLLQRPQRWRRALIQENRCHGRHEAHGSGQGQVRLPVELSINWCS